MAQKLDANLNVIQETPIELELINGDLSIISKLDDEPNDVGGLTSTQLKAKFDEAGNTIKDYLNNSLIPAVLAADATEATRSAAEAERVENEVERVANENVRVPAETARIAAENIRIENEATRVASEEDRISAEAIRKSNEAQRIANENAREDLETGYVARAEAAAKRAEDAAADAENTVGGDYVTQEELDEAIGAIPTPDVYTKTETLADDTKALFGLGSGAVPNDIFAKMSEGVFSKIVGKYPETSTFGELAVGQSVFINVNDTPTEFLVAHQGVPQTCIFADSTYDGTFLIAKNIYEKKAWSWQLGTTDYSLSEINAYLNGDFYNAIDDEAKALIKQINVPYRSGTSGQTINLLPAKVFLPSVREVQETTNGTYKPSDGGKFSLFNDSANRIARFEGVATPWWTRSGHINSQSSGVWYITESGGSASSGTGGVYGIRPVVVMQPNGLVYLDKNENAYIKQEYDNFLVNVIDEIIGIPASQIVDGVRIATGSYVGTDIFGSLENATVLTFDFEPKMVRVVSDYGSSDTPGFTALNGTIKTRHAYSTASNGGYDIYFAWEGNVFKYYNSGTSGASTATQYNSSSYTYYYIAIG